MEPVHLVITGALLAVMLLSVRRAFFGRPPERRSLRSIPLIFGGLALYGLGFVAAGLVAQALGAALVFLGVEMIALGGWLTRGAGPDDDDPADLPEDPPPFRWEDFERAFREYEASRRQPV